MAVGRRERLKRRIRNEGLEHLEPHEVLEAMLYPFIPRKDTVPIARELLARFGSLAGVMQADEDELFAVKGMTLKAAKMLPFQYRTVDYIRKNYRDERIFLSNQKQAARFCMALARQGQQGSYFITLDAHCRLIGCTKADWDEQTGQDQEFWRGIGGVFAPNTSVVLVARLCAEQELPLPSIADYGLLNCLKQPLQSAGVTLGDCLVVNKTGGIAFREMGLLDDRYQLINFIRTDWLPQAKERGCFKEDQNGEIRFFTFKDFISEK